MTMPAVSAAASRWRSGIAAWLGWMFDGLDMHLYTLVALPLVAHLLGNLPTTDPAVRETSAWIQAAFLAGWACGGAVFGIIGDRLGRSRTLVLTILTYALFTGLGYFAQTWWQLAGFRFLAALGIGGEWAVGAALLAESWPTRMRPWLAAILQSAVNVGIMLATLAGYLLAGFPPETVFLVGLLPAVITLWIRRAVPETEAWSEAQAHTPAPRLADLWGPGLRRITATTLLVCGLLLTAHWAFMFWYVQHLRSLAEAVGVSVAERSRLASLALLVVMVASIVGNFTAAGLARHFGWRRAVATLAVMYAGLVWWGFGIPRPLEQVWPFLAAIGVCQGLFALFTMYLPPLFPTLLRTTGAGLCYNAGRLAAAAGTVLFVMVLPVGEVRLALVWAAVLFIPGAILVLTLPESGPTE